MSEKKIENVVERAIYAAGSANELAKIQGVTPQAVNKWRRRGYFPLDQIPVILDRFPDIFQAIDFIDAFRLAKQRTRH